MKVEAAKEGMTRVLEREHQSRKDMFQDTDYLESIDHG